MQGVAELVEQRPGLVEAEQGGLARCRLVDVQIVQHHRPGGQQPRLRHQRVHPGAAALARPRVVIGEEQAERTAVRLEYFPHLHVRVVAGQVLAAGEGHAVELRGRVEDAVLHDAVELEERAQGGGVDGEPVGAGAFGVERPVPRLQLDAVGRGVGPQDLRFRLECGQRRAGQPS